MYFHGWNCPFFCLTAAAFSLSTGQISRSVVYISHLYTEILKTGSRLKNLKVTLELHAPTEIDKLWQKHNVKTNLFNVCLAVENADGLSSAQTCRTHLMAVLRGTWLSFISILQMHPTCLMPLNHDKVDFMRKPESAQPNTRGLQGHG